MSNYASFDTGFATLQMNAARERVGSSGGKGGKSWLVALATAMGSTQGKLAHQMMTALDKMDSLSNADMKKPGAAQKFQVAATEFQAIAQMFSIISNANSTSLKAIGEGMTAMARKS